MKSSFKERAFWAYATWLEVITRYRRTRLGVLWMFMPSLVYVLGLGYLYAHMMGKSAAEFIPHLGIGYVLWRFAIQAVIESGDTFVVHQAFIMDGRTRFTDYVLRTLSRSFLYLMAGLAVVVTILLIDPRISNLLILTLLVTVPIYVANVLWMSVIVALLGGRVRDTKEVVSTGLIFGFLLTPILWDVQMVPPDSLRGVIVRFNPFLHLIEFVRAPVLGKDVETLTFWVVGGLTIGGWMLAAFLYRRYARFVPLWI